MRLAATIVLIVTFALFGLLAVSAFAAEAVLTEDERMQCRLGGGCLFMTQDALTNQLRAARDAGRRAAEVECSRPMT